MDSCRMGPAITGIALEWPEHLMNADEFEEYVEQLYGKQHHAWVQRLLKRNRQTLIAQRPVLDLKKIKTWTQNEKPDISDGDRIFRTYGIELAARACTQALIESSVRADQLTHIVAVTATNAGCPGMDHLVAEKLDMPACAERTLINGAGCAGGMAALRVAGDIAFAKSFRRQPARILVVACELSCIQIRAELEAASTSQQNRIGPILFSDGAAAMVVCNDLALRPDSRCIYRLDDWSMSVLPNSMDDVTVNVGSLGFLVGLSKRVPDLAAAAVTQPFEILNAAKGGSLAPQDYDWALHPGGFSILRSVQDRLDLSDHALRAAYDIYKHKGNTASVSVIAVMDRLRRMGPGKENVVACAFGPGMRVEMAVLRRPQDVVAAAAITSKRPAADMLQEAVKRRITSASHCIPVDTDTATIVEPNKS